MIIDKLINSKPTYLYKLDGEVCKDEYTTLEGFSDCIKWHLSLNNFNVIGVLYNDQPEDYYGSGVVLGYDKTSSECFVIELSHCSCYGILDVDAWEDIQPERYSVELLDKAYSENRLTSELTELIEHCIAQM
ncbi:hypothetical protein [Proteus mirabilis]|uniref:hypothetical protein n=1 Tax=Proteus mirabilis TaxID=584 RepID=UPI0034D45A9B